MNGSSKIEDYVDEPDPDVIYRVGQKLDTHDREELLGKIVVDISSDDEDYLKIDGAVENSRERMRLSTSLSYSADLVKVRKKFSHPKNGFSSDEMPGMMWEGGEARSQIQSAAEPSNQGSFQDLKLLYDMRLRELDSLRQMMQDNELENQKINGKLALALADKERLVIELKEKDCSVYTTRQQVEDLKKQVETMRKDCLLLQEKKEEVLLELEATRSTVVCLETKIATLQKSSLERFETTQYESSMKALSEKYKNDVKSLQSKLNTCLDELLAKEKEISNLKYKATQMDDKYSETIMEKSNTLTVLSKKLDEAQKQYQELLSSTQAEEKLQQQVKMKILEEDNTRLKYEMLQMQRRIDDREADLKQLKTLDSGVIEDSHLQTTQVNVKLKEELDRALKSMSTKRTEICKLHEELKKKEDQIQFMLMNERQHSADAARFREDTERYISSLKQKLDEVNYVKDLEVGKLKGILDQTNAELEKKSHNESSKCEELEKENRDLKLQMSYLETHIEDEKLKTMNKYNEQYLKFHDERIRKTREEVESWAKLEIAKKEFEVEKLEKEIYDVKNMYIELNAKNESLTKQLERERSVSGQSAVDVDHVKRLQQELEFSKSRILEMDKTLQNEVEKSNREKELAINDKLKVCTENDLLKTEIDTVTKEKNMYYLEVEKVAKENASLKELVARMKREVRTSPLKEWQQGRRKVEHKCTSPLKVVTAEASTSPHPASRLSPQDPDRSPPASHPRQVARAEVLSLMQQLAEHHDQELMLVGAKHRQDMMRIEAKYKEDLEKRTDTEIRELIERHEEELHTMETRYKTEMKNRIEQEKKEAVVGLITEWTCEVRRGKEDKARIEQELQQTKTELERMERKYQDAKKAVVHCKTFYKDKLVECRKVEQNYEKSLEELNENIHRIVHVKQDEVQEKVDILVKKYDRKINKLKSKVKEANLKSGRTKGSLDCREENGSERERTSR